MGNLRYGSLTFLGSAVSPMGYTEWDGKIGEAGGGEENEEGVGKDYNKSLSVEFCPTDLPGNPAQP